VIRARTGRRISRPIPGFIVLAVLLVAACSGELAPTAVPASIGIASPDATADEGSSGSPTASLEVTPPPPTVTPPPTVINGCSGSAENQTFFAEAAKAMRWPVYCAVLGDHWFLDTGTYRLANGGELEVAYNGPGDVHISIVEGNVCDQVGSDIDVCAPRDSVIGPAPLGDQMGELARLSNGLVLDVDRGANPSWRVTGLGLSEAAFRAICAAMYRVPPG
jgi:hypothetical protein